MFVISKLLGVLVLPANVVLIAVMLAAGLLHTRWWRAGRRLLGAGAVLLVAIAILPWDAWLLVPLEDRFPPPAALPAQVAGIVVLGGAVDPVVSAARGQPSLNGAVERVTSLVELARRYPEATLVFSGGSGAVTTQEMKEAPVVRTFLEQMGLDVDRVTFEAQSRNTRENATLTRELVSPKPGETWLLVTSALHMPRSVGVFRAAGWSVLPYPVDYQSTGRESTFSLRFNLGAGLGILTAVLHEWQGMAYYRLRGWSDRLYPGPQAL